MNTKSTAKMTVQEAMAFYGSGHPCPSQLFIIPPCRGGRFFVTQGACCFLTPTHDDPPVRE